MTAFSSFFNRPVDFYNGERLALSRRVRFRRNATDAARRAVCYLFRIIFSVVKLNFSGHETADASAKPTASGMIVNPSRAAIGANIASAATETLRTTTTNGAGSYPFAALLPGTYALIFHHIYSGLNIWHLPSLACILSGKLIGPHLNHSNLRREYGQPVISSRPPKSRPELRGL